MIRRTDASPAYVCEPSTDTNGLSRDDVRHLFSGAPQFMLEKGSHGRSFPQIVFPWDTDLAVADLVGRRWLKHESFALCTLHAHLPIPDQLDWQPTSTGPLKKEDAWKRPAFELGIFESPNMLAIDGKEPGTVGMRNFLEMPVADRLRTLTQAQETLSSHRRDIANMSTTDVLKALPSPEDCPAIGKHAPWQDRLQLIQGGPRAWKRAGVREISVRTITERLAKISSLHDEVVKEGWRVTILDKQDVQALHQELFTEFLYPPHDVAKEADPQSMKHQLESLNKVLTTPGAWIDFSRVESRLRLGQMLWVATPQEGEHEFRDEPAAGKERWWLLVQLLLSIELVLRLDAALRLGLAQHARGFHISPEDMHHFNKLRNTKLNWDLVLARRFLDHLLVIPTHLRPHETAVGNEPNRHGLISKFRHKSSDTIGSINNADVWDEILILPRRPKSQLDGLILFARLVNWPEFDTFASRLRQELDESSLATESFLESTYGKPIRSASSSFQSHLPDTVELEAATETRPGGWLSRSWLTGLVLPGDMACHLLMGTLLENNPHALAKVGTTAVLRGGFIIDDRSWWSKACIVGRVLAPSEGVSECMGWISTPGLWPVNKQGAPLLSRWVRVETAEVPKLREKSRIHDGAQVSIESSPLGTGHGKVMASEFSMPGLGLVDHGSESQIHLGQVVLQERQSHQISRTRNLTDGALTAAVQFFMKTTDKSSPLEVSFRLTHDVYFVSAHPCRPPHGHAVHTSPDGSVHPIHQHGESLPSHPLHQTYRYVLKTVQDLASTTPPNHHDPKEAVCIIDARHSREKDIFVRAWCSQVGRHAIVSRIGRSCLSCSIREAKAIEVGVVIRVGGNE